MTSIEEERLLIDLKGYPHLYDKECKDFRDVVKRNNSWKKIEQILHATDIEYIFKYFVYRHCM
ncbi:hypothetical protein ALC60_11330 [Trachymyrmex zeteki]|uniref:MADF domain-containing protein n=1 Tax=Mycetomoellerius zeteki TaxID=64791 RepID=A0A151WP13_9HYME|nr:hypothetical protein ALC60_11330 [Trachymyrmex zeteki]